MKTSLALFFIFLSLGASAQKDIREGQEVKVGNKKVIYTYKQYEKFDFADLNSEGDSGAPSDISISPIHCLEDYVF